jgi:prepilin-type N-terminal cleavage/methylation domain-containing protein
MNKKRGFTLLELLAWMSVAAVIVVVVTSNMREAFTQYRNAVYSSNMQIVFSRLDSSILTDIKNGNGEYSVEADGFSIGDTQYRLEDGTFKRIRNGHSYTLCGDGVSFQLIQKNGQDYLVLEYSDKGLSFRREYRLKFLISG